MANDKMQTKLCERIAELEKENERMKGILLRNDETIKTLNDIKNKKCIEIEELKTQIEEMKCCGNCSNYGCLDMTYLRGGVCVHKQEWKLKKL